MNIVFYVKSSGRCPVKEFIEEFNAADKAKILACLKSIEELGFNSPRVELRQIRGRLWEIKIRSYSAAVRIFYIGIALNKLVLLHAYKKQSQKHQIRKLKLQNNDY